MLFAVIVVNRVGTKQAKNRDVKPCLIAARCEDIVTRGVVRPVEISADHRICVGVYLVAANHKRVNLVVVGKVVDRVGIKHPACHRPRIKAENLLEFSHCLVDKPLPRCRVIRHREAWVNVPIPTVSACRVIGDSNCGGQRLDNLVPEAKLNPRVILHRTEKLYIFFVAQRIVLQKKCRRQVHLKRQSKLRLCRGKQLFLDFCIPRLKGADEIHYVGYLHISLLSAYSNYSTSFYLLQ